MRSLLAALLLVALGLSTAQAFIDFGALDCLTTRSIDGRCNNLLFPSRGGSDNYLKRGAEGVKYADGIREPILSPNPRTVSNELFRGDDTILDPAGHNLLWTFFGQFVAHDLLGVHRQGDLNASQIPDHNNTAEVWRHIPLEQSDDAMFLMTPRITVPWIRIIQSRGDFVDGRFEVGSESTAWLDLDTVYGKHDEVTELLRTHTDGLLAFRVYDNYTAHPPSSIPVTQVAEFGEWMPLLVDIDPDRTAIPVSNQLVTLTTPNIPERFFATGDGRNGENYALNMFHGLFFREHNRLARELKAKHPGWKDEKLFQTARKINIAQYQAIVMYEYLPSILYEDMNLVGEYDGYQWQVDPTVSHLFAFSMRFGHSTVPNTFYLKNECNVGPFGSSRDGPRSGQSAASFMPADQLAQVGTPENVLHALLFETCRRVDPQFPESMRSIRGAFTDTSMQNQVRVAENGIPDYYTIRKLWYGGPQADLYALDGCNTANMHSPSPDPIECFRYISSNETVAQTLRDLYGKVNNINFFTSVLAEEPENAVVGRTHARIIADQFKRVRDGDRWWFESQWSGLSRREIRDLRRDMKMHVLLKRNFPSLNVQEDAFYSPDPSHFASC